MSDTLVVRLPPGVDSLERLFDRCHRDELVPLATLLRVDATRLGLADLAAELSRALRRAASHQGKNLLLRKGEGPSYEDILADVADRPRVQPDEVEEVEIAELRAWLAKRWDEAGEAEHARWWRELGLGDSPPARGAQALEEAEGRLGRAFGYMVSGVVGTLTSAKSLALLGAFVLSPLGCVVRPFLLPVTPFLAWRAMRPDPERRMAMMLQVARLRQIVLHRVTLGFVGSPSTGKDAAIRALFGIDSGNISPVAGSTREVQTWTVPTSTALYIVNTPGMGDVTAAVTEEARQVLDHIDVYVYLVNAEGGVQARELADYRRCVASGKPTLVVVNKVDVLRPRDKDRYLEDARGKLGAPAEDFLTAAFDPLPELSPTPIGREAVHAWIADHLRELGKDPAELPPLPVSAAPPTSPPPPPEPGTPA